MTGQACSCGAYPHCPCGRQRQDMVPGGLMAPWQWTTPPKGCICPPGAENTCQRSDCGRRDGKPTTNTTQRSIQNGS